MIAQEIVENNMLSQKSSSNKIMYKIAALELKHEERKTLINRWGSEKCKLHNLNILLKDKLLQVQNNAIKLQSKLLNNKKQLSLLKIENTQLNEQLDQIKHKNVSLEFQVQEIPQLRLKELELESKNEQIIDLLQKIDCLKNENKYLREQNNEPVIELEATKMLGNMGTGRAFDSHVSNFSKEKDSPNCSANCFSKVKELTTKLSVEESGSDCANTFETSEFDFDTWNKVENAQRSDHKSPQTPSMFAKNIKTTLPFQSQIESCNLDKLIDCMEHLKQMPKSDHEQNESLESRNFVESQDSFMTYSPLNKYSTERPLNKQFENSIETEFMGSTLLEMTNGSIEKLNQMYNQCKSENQELQYKCAKIEKFWESKYNEVCEIANKALNEAKRLKDEGNDLKLTMDALSNEYFECEEYWLLKLEEERKLNKLEKKVSNEKLNNLEVKIKGYIDMLEETADNKLPSIDEHVEFEEQINCIQLEFSSYCMKIEKEMENLKIENERLKSQIVIPVDKVDLEGANSQFKEKYEKCLKNEKTNGEFKNKQFDLKYNHEKSGMECQSLMQQRNLLRYEIFQLKEYLNFLSVSSHH
ncbi:WEB family protein At4g27595, chloroplastic-like [Myzus persicae]|uniref:WEB family protein At4g27595, chloroplastic-like n=1 Tax=Myzus persicae TaxID=13164 RepID=UPI000B9344E5|nr:WEB family protein At4g27595, chloroplastic-like [Myzus persicae]XP_022182912.1 WEB family protein At4g27595, chloroplastic-like [Myzus persicae]XP_022182913.1 WEB family protein At4g27595, chloroplastic-like [Myzus persicae]